MALVSYTDDILAAVDRWDGVLRRPSEESRQRPEGVQVLKSSVLERIFATSYWFMPAVWFGPIIGYGLYRSVADPTLSPGWTVTLFVVGVLFWTLTEYVLHRGLFHLRPGGWWRPSKLRLFMIHGYHHEYPNDRMRLVAPPIMSWPIGAVILGGFILVAGPHLCWGLIAGTATGYLAYDWIHFYTHHAKPRTRVGRFLQRYHLEHHYKDQDSHFGISSPLWDLAFRTFRAQDAAARRSP
ncbi:MAG: sterol desaturase family protein [Deltaproteobacteria bacterium]|nr:sterol desaturase family protein [Deltaproteobacteria bacterium]